jgi:hypothetical protein
VDDTRAIDTDDFDPSGELLAVATAVIPGWLWRCVETAGRTGGVAIEADTEVERMIGDTSAELVGQLERLLAADVEAQRQNPLSLFREAVTAPTALLAARGVRPAGRDPFAVEAFPDDLYGLVPATWSDIDPDLQAPGIAWGAWKAMAVIRRHRRPADG